MKLRHVRRALVVLGIGLLVAPLSAAPTSAQDVQDMNVSRSEPLEARDYAPILVNNTDAAAGLGTGVLLHRPGECRTATYCDVIDVHVDAKAFTDQDAYELRIELSWPNNNCNGDACTNDLDLYIYDQELGRRIASGATAMHPEMAVIDRPETKTYFIVINNFSGPNIGYTTEVDLAYVGKLKQIPKFTRPTADAGPMFTPLPDATPPKLDRPDQSLSPRATLAPVLTPGPDGAPTSLALEGVRAGAKVDKGGLTWWGYLIMSFAIAGVGGGAGVIIFRRVRARAV